MSSTPGTRFMHSSSIRNLAAAFCAVLFLSTFRAQAQTAATPAQTPGQAAAQQAPQSSGKTPDTGGLGAKDAPTNGQKTGTDPKSSTKPATAGEQAASTTRLKLGPLDPAVPPPNLPKNRPVIGVAMGGGGALAMSEIGVLAWFEQHHIPVDVVAGTSMGSILAALYSTGKTPEEMTHIMT